MSSICINKFNQHLAIQKPQPLNLAMLQNHVCIITNKEEILSNIS